jgi:hypothetical protein
MAGDCSVPGDEVIFVVIVLLALPGLVELVVIDFEIDDEE